MIPILGPHRITFPIRPLLALALSLLFLLPCPSQAESPATRPATSPAKSVGNITLHRLRAPKDPDLIERIDLTTGAVTQLAAATADRSSIRSFCLSPDAKQFLLDMGSGLDWYVNNEIYHGNLADGTLRRLTENQIYDGDPAWSPNGMQMAFTRGWGVNGHVQLLDLTTGKERALATPGVILTRQPQWLPGGRLLVVGFDANKKPLLAELDPAKDSVRIVLRGDADYLELSPDRKSLALTVSRRAAILDIAAAKVKLIEDVPPKPNEDAPRDIGPKWSPDGKSLAWIRNDQRTPTCTLMIYEIQTAKTRSLPLPDEAGDNILWSPAGDQLMCVTHDHLQSTHRLSIIPSAGGPAKELLTSKHQLHCLGWTKP